MFFVLTFSEIILNKFKYKTQNEELNVFLFFLADLSFFTFTSLRTKGG